MVLLISVLLKIFPPAITLEFNRINTHSSDENIVKIAIISQNEMECQEINNLVSVSHSSRHHNLHHPPKQRNGLKPLSTAHGLLASAHARKEDRTDLCLLQRIIT
ncbi:hypothetical protein CEXT_795291 [Caerostris extrusa]|uniref:Uncharacterized protein n=1 Tax=Caerostris extrusa TaxID=172846 RepID=A0AAV4WQC1_CAEEX|nr:hypothetical protein CEXT_795291 [Caerostris extrusa]